MKTLKKEYIIESKGFNYVSNSIDRKKEKINKMIKEMSVEYNMSIEEVKIKFNIKL